ncbi:MAG: hypothetical protein LBR11_01390 [Deltaproteobacteria bacterium]|jgi:hypothetical protein|nr:hypothetical protein [Deltaproteobacteria bacterium]
MKKVMVAILALLGLLGSQAAQAWDWPFFSKKEEPPAEAVSIPPTLAAPKNPGPALNPLSYQRDDFLSENRLKFVISSYARSYNLPGAQPKLKFDDSLLATRVQSAGLSYQPTDYLTLYSEFSGLSQTLIAANPAFPNETPELSVLGMGWSAGANFDYKGLEARLKYFDFDYQRQLQSLTPLDRSLNIPEESGRAQGVELSASWALDRAFDWDFELRPYLTMTQFFDQWSPPAFGGSDSELLLSYGLLFNHETSGLSMSLEANSPRRRAPLYYSFIGQGLAGETVYDFHLVKRLYDWKDQGRLLLKADVTNIGDTPINNNRPNRNQNEEGRTFKTGLRYEY